MMFRVDNIEGTSGSPVNTQPVGPPVSKGGGLGLKTIVEKPTEPGVSTFQVRRKAKMKKLSVNRTRVLLGSLALLFIAVFAVGSYAQVNSGTITGLVTDNAGAAVSNAQIVVTETTTGSIHQLKSGDTGLYTVPFLPPGHYSVAISAAGFSQFKVESLVLQVDQTLRVDASLKIGAVSESVTVTASSVNLNTDSSTIGQVISEVQVEQLPLNGRNFGQLLLLSAGAVDTPGGASTSNRPGYYDVYNLGGSRDSSNGFTIDGISNLEIFYMLPAILISPEVVQEFKEQTKTYSAAYGGAANQVNLSTKSGSNDIHGSVYEFLRNDMFDALNYFQTSGALLRQHQYGYSFGAPVYIPKLYDGRNKTFVFANFERLQVHQTGNEFGLLPNATQLSGAFVTPIMDPDPTSPTYGQLFPKNSDGLYQIPSSRFSNLANTTIAGGYIPAINYSGPQGNFRGTVNSPTTMDQQTYRLDQKLAARDLVTFRATLYDYAVTSPGLLASQDSIASYNDHNYVASETHTFSPTLLNQFSFGYLDNTANTAGPSAPAADIAGLKLKNTYAAAATSSFPNIQFYTGGYSMLGGPDNDPSLYYQKLFQYQDTVSVTKGRHTFQIGFDLHHYLINKSEVVALLGDYQFDGSFTLAPGNQENGDNALADFELGWPVQGNAAVPTPSNPNPFHLDIVQNTLAAFVNDDWKVTPKLTLNLGLRYDFQGVPYEQHNHWAWLDPDLVTSTGTGGLYVADKSIVGLGAGYYVYGGKTAGNSQKTPFAPRIGFAYRPLNKMVVRGGYGIFYDQYDLSEYESGSIYPYTLSPSVRGYNTNDLFLTPSEGSITPAEFKGFYFLQPSKIRDPYIQNWSLSVERELTSKTKLEVNYSGSKGTNLEGRRLVNQSLPYTTPPTDPSQIVVPYTNLGQVIAGVFGDWSNYDAGSVTLDHRSRDLYLLAAYTFGKSLDDKSSSVGTGNDGGAGWAGPMDSAHPKKDYGRSTFDARHRLVTSFVYRLPFGRGKRFGASIPKAVDAVVGGWQLNGIQTYQSGLPFWISAPDSNAYLGTYAQRADLIGNPYPPGFKKSINEWFNIAAFAAPTPGVFGNSPRNFINMPSTNNWDISVAKNFPIYERLTFQFRCEAFDVFNRPQFWYPDNGVTDSTFGVITGATASRQIQFAGKIVW